MTGHETPPGRLDQELDVSSRKPKNQHRRGLRDLALYIIFKLQQDHALALLSLTQQETPAQKSSYDVL